MSGSRHGTGRTVVLTLLSETWDDLVVREFMRPVDRLALDLVADPDVACLVVAEPWRSRPVRVVRRLLTRRDDTFPSSEPRQARRLVQPLRLRRRDPGDPPGAERTARRYGTVLRRELAALRPTGDVQVVTCSPTVAAWAGLDAVGPVLYYARDDFSHHPGYADLRPALRAAYTRIARDGVPVAAVSRPILESIGATGPTLVLPNGIEPAEWRRPAPPPAWFTALPGPRLVYTGSLDRRLDPDLVRASTSAGTVVLLGPTMDAQHVARLARIPGVVVHDGVGRGELAAVVAAADACVLPHVVDGLTRAMSPLKLYEYVAAGRPVVSVDLPPVRDVHPRVRVVRDAAAFAAAALEAVETGPMDEDERRALLDAWSWSARFAVLKAFLTSSRPAAPAG